MDRRSLFVEFRLLGVGSYHAVLVSRFELVRIVSQRLQIGHTVIAGARRKHVMEYEGAKRGVPPGASAPDSHALSVDIAALFQIPGGVDAVFDVNDAPLPFQPFSICP